MKVSCPSCGTNYNLDEKRIPPGGAKLKCAKCQTTFPIKRDGASGGDAPAAAAPRTSPGSAITATIPSMPRPGAAKPASLGFDMNVATNPAIPLPGSSGPRPGMSGSGSTVTSAIPLPGGGGSGPALTAAVPLPGGMAASYDEEATSAAIPLPGADDLPEPPSASPWDGESTRVASIPMPAAALRPLTGARPAASAAIPLPGSGSGAPLGAATPSGGFSGVATTPGMPFARSSAAKSSAAAIPLPGLGGASSRASTGAGAAAIPLPGLGGASSRSSAGAGASAIPLPAADPGDGIDFADADLVEPPPPARAPAARTPSISAAVPLPSGQDSNESTQIGAEGGFDFGELPPPPEPPPEPRTQGAGSDFSLDFGEAPVPMPGSSGSSGGDVDFSGDFGEAPVPMPGPSSKAAQSSDVDFSGDFGEAPVPTPGASSDGGVDFSTDFGEPPSSEAVPMPSPSESSAVDFGEAPAQISQAPASRSPFDFTGPDDQTSTDQPRPSGSGLDFGEDLPASPRGSAQKDDLLDFGELPAPAGASGQSGAAPEADAPSDFSFDFSPPPPPSRPAPAELPPEPGPPSSVGFGEVDFGAPSSSPSQVSDPLEFDPTSKSSPTAPRDELEADLSAPIPPPSSSGPADGLEMLSFIEDAAKQQGPSPAPKSSRSSRWHVRRRSGKVFGPFDEGVVVKMLEDGQLLGNEDISSDGESWAPMSSAPTLAAAIQRLMDSPRAPSPSSPSGLETAARSSGPQAASVDRLKQLYEGRMAAVAVVDRRQSSERFQSRLPLLIAAGVVAVLLLTGGAFTFTRYGPFGMRLLFPAKLSQSSPQYAQYLDAKKALLQDTFKSYREARDLTGKILAATEYPEVRAVWCQAVFYLQRRYAAASAQERQDAAAALPRIELLGMKNAEVVKALAGRALAARTPDDALPLLLEAKARASNESDRELDLLLAEAYTSKGDFKAAEDVLQRVLKAEAGSAKALHALGNLKQSSNQADEAAKAYAAALQADPNHAISAVELAAVDLLVRHNDAEGLKAVEQALSPQSENLLGPAELSRAKALRGVALAAQFKPKEATEELDQALKLDPDSVFAKAMLARVLIGQREFKRALPLFKEASTREPANLEYAEGYLLALIATGNMSEALTQVAQANKRFPGNARIAFLYGRISDALDNAADAEGHYKRAIAADSSLYQANLALARFYLRFRRVADAKPQLEDAEKKAPSDAAVHSGLGELALTEGLLADARREFETAARLDPTQADARLGLAKVEFAESRFQEALQEADQALALDDHIKDGRLQRALALWKLGRLDDAVEELAKARTDDPKSARVMITTGAVQLDKGNLPQAESALLSALSMESSNHEAHFYMARVKAKRLEYTQAIESMKNALERAPKRAAYHYELGLIYRDAKRLNEAIESWNTAVKLDPRHADALEALGQAYLDRGELDRAVESFDASLKADPTRTRILGLVGDCYFQAAKWDDAVNRYLLALKADPKLVQSYYKLGRAYSEKGEPSKSISYYQRATQLDRDNPMPYYYLGYAYKERGKKREAVGAFRNYLERRPDAEDKKEIEDEIYDLEQNYQ